MTGPLKPWDGLMLSKVLAAWSLIPKVPYILRHPELDPTIPFLKIPRWIPIFLQRFLFDQSHRHRHRHTHTQTHTQTHRHTLWQLYSVTLNSQVENGEGTAWWESQFTWKVEQAVCAWLQSSAVANERRNSAAKPRFRGWKHEEPWIKTWKSRVTACERPQQVRSESVLSEYHIRSAVSLLGSDCWRDHCPPALEKGGDGNDGSEPFGTGGDTHTHTVPLRGAHVKNLNSHLKSLRNKRKERQKEQR